MSEGNITECPNCGSRMELKEAPFRYHGSYIGNFEAYVCGVCHHIYFTENAKKEIMEVHLIQKHNLSLQFLSDFQN